VLAHQHLGPPWLAGRDRFENPMMVVVTATNVTIFESHDVDR
jgi:hypothetical protein